MRLRGKTIVITGAASGIGAALARRFSSESPAGIVVSDVDAHAADQVAEEVGGIAVPADVADETTIRGLVAIANSHFGPIDLMCLNAGIATPGGVETSNELWQRTWEVNVMSHVYGARAVLPQMLERKTGYLLHTASAAGLLSSIAAAPYAVTKHAVVALAEWLSITYGKAGIKVSCLSPQYVDTDMLDVVTEVSDAYATFVDSMTIAPHELADEVVAGLEAEQFHILPHPEVADYLALKSTDPEKWLGAMRNLNSQLAAGPEQ
ncbi:MAG: SDR family oxidoreductase [bacterium]|nr:SDR family oxidoreductase [bacterium]